MNASNGINVNAPTIQQRWNNKKKMFSAFSFCHTIVSLSLCKCKPFFYLQNNGYRCQRYTPNLFHLWHIYILYTTISIFIFIIFAFLLLFFVFLPLLLLFVFYFFFHFLPYLF